jgi:hypothetical protein
MITDEQIVAALQAQGFTTHMQYFGDPPEMLKATKLVIAALRNLLGSNHPVGKMVTYQPKRGRKGVISATAWGPVDMEVTNVGRVIDEAYLYAGPPPASDTVSDHKETDHGD